MEERLSRGRCVGVRAEADGWKAATTSFAAKWGIKCVLVCSLPFEGRPVQTEARPERCYSRAGEGRS